MDPCHSPTPRHIFPPKTSVTELPPGSIYFFFALKDVIVPPCHKYLLTFDPAWELEGKTRAVLFINPSEKAVESV